MGTEGNLQLYQKYIARLPEYHTQKSVEKCDTPGEVFSGWKLHLNVSPDNVREVSRFLLDNGYWHKYISEGDIDHGKIFTVYVGSKELTERLVREIYNGVGFLLEEPRAEQEILVAPRIVARFATQMHTMIDGQYCYKGIPARKYYETGDKEKLYKVSMEFLLKEFGEYFGGGIEYYNPDK